MACGIYLGILLVYLLQAEHVICSWASQEVQGKTYVGYGQYGDRHLRRNEMLPQNNFRQAALAKAVAQSSSDGFSWADGLAKPRAGYSSLKVVRPRPAAVPRKAMYKKAERPYLSSVVVSSGSVSRHHQQASHPTGRKDAGLEKGKGAERSSTSHLPGYGKRKFLAGMRTSAKGTASKVPIGQEVDRRKQVGLKYNRRKISVLSPRQWRQWPEADRRLYSPMDVLIIPERYGGFPIRRLKDPEPPRVALGRSAARHLRPETKWTRVKLRF
ncbi:uncharacterized protein LOC144067118 [Stigmatopora argus]